jgi:REP element-mobilizing transposase RayT
VKYRRSLFTEEIEKVIVEVMGGFKEHYEIEVHSVGFDQNHVHMLFRFLLKYSGGQVVRLMKSITAGGFPSVSQCQTVVVGRGVFVRWILYCHGEWQRKQESD